MMQRSLSERLRVLRARRGLSLTEAAERAGVTRDTISDLERGKRRAYMPTLTKIAKGYRVPVEELLEEPVPLGEAPEAGSSETRVPEESARTEGEQRALSIREISLSTDAVPLPGLKAARERRNVSVNKLSVHTGLQPSVISDLEGGDRLANPETIELLRSALGYDCYRLELILPPDSVDFDAFRSTDRQENERMERMREELAKLDTAVASLPNQRQRTAREKVARGVDESLEREAREQPEAG
jgi:transcriptional regulator with XRE-family HTH domain